LLIKNKDNYTLQPLPQTGIKTISIFSSDGKRLSAVSDIYESFKIEYLPSGIYHMYLQTQDGSYYYEKLIFQN
ncbi:MAG: T9SS type A sorting domain-containing protein, partial [Crocinitomicaceae bacterium]